MLKAPRANPMKKPRDSRTPGQTQNYLIPTAPTPITISFSNKISNTGMTLPSLSRVPRAHQASRSGSMKPPTSNQSAPANNPEPEYNPFVLQFEEMEFQRHLFSKHICDVAPSNLLRQAVKLPDGITRVCWANAIMKHAFVENILLTYTNLEKLRILLNEVGSNGCDMLDAVNAIGLYSQVSVGIIECEQLENEDDIITCPIHGDKSKPTIWFAVYGKKYHGATHWMPASLTE